MVDLTRYAYVRGDVTLEQVRAYLPSNYRADVGAHSGKIVVQGIDDHGWTLDGYVIPRLASGLIVAEEIEL